MKILEANHIKTCGNKIRTRLIGKLVFAANVSMYACLGLIVM